MLVSSCLVPTGSLVLVPLAWALAVKWKRSVLAKPGVASRSSLNSSSFPHPLETESGRQIHSWREPCPPPSPDPQEQTSTIKQLRIIWVKLAKDVDHGEWEPALEPRYIDLTHGGTFRPSFFSFFNRRLFRVLSKEADGPSHWNCCCGLFGLVTSTYHGLSSGGRMQSKSWKHFRMWAVVGLPPACQPC